ncbi:NAD(P)/FAD-dependent oxidoreductase [Simkania negevensis]|uniref:NADH:ubiquinone reductase (non-electrogenic) n=1 Tax=Simkania negevensis TaxID=83561 RepID=A0ABS3AS73_9BACT|nr:NAD(P)/FAD-dependent oxidoreductase [Simkania negevensis]
MGAKDPAKKRPQVIIIGGGFGGLTVAKSLGWVDVDVLIIDKTNHHLFQPLLYQVASAALSPADIAYPIREIVSDQSNTSVVMAEVTKIDTEKKEVWLAHDNVFPYDYLVIAVGARHSYFGHDEWEEYAPGVKSLQDALKIRNKILTAFEKAERCKTKEEALKHLNFVIVGGGPTGVEIAGAIAEIAHQTMLKNFRKIDTEDTKIYLIEGAPHILSAYPKRLATKAHKALEKLGVEIITGTHVTDMNDQGVYLGDRFIQADNIVWAAGNKASPLLKTLNTELKKTGHAIVNSDWSIPGHPETFVIGDAAYFEAEDGRPLPGISPVAIQGGRYVADVIMNKLPPEKRSPFKYFDKGSLATIGRAHAVARIGNFEFSGFFAWLIWVFIHIAYLIGFRSRFTVMMQWGFLYFTGRRGARLINKAVKDDPPHKDVVASEKAEEPPAKKDKE